jgi:hypothetical protein
MPVMRSLMRKSAALVAAYGIALQALFSSFAVIALPGVDPIAVICTSDGSAEHPPSSPQHRNDCGACLAACSGAWALAPPSQVFAFLEFANTPERPLARLDPQPPRKRHHPQASRAPPIFS